MINLLSIFSNLENERYCVVKLDPLFPAYRPGSDVDIFVYNLPTFMSKLTRYLGQILEDNQEVHVHQIEKFHVHVNYITSGRLEIRFDLFMSLPHYKKACVKESLFESVVEGALLREYKREGVRAAVRVLEPIDECIIRYLEYNEYFAANPDKIKHAEHIVRNLGGPQIDDFITKLHHYISFPSETSGASKATKRFRGWRTSIVGRTARFVKRRLKRFVRVTRDRGIRLR